MPALSTYRGGGGGTSLSSKVPVQVVANTTVNRSAHTDTSTSSRASTGCTVTITPTYASSELLIMVTANMDYGRDTAAHQWELYRTGTALTATFVVSKTTSYPYYYGMLYRTGASWGADTTYFKDTTHNTTSSITYTLYHSQYSSTSASYTAHQGQSVVMTVTEITA